MHKFWKPRFQQVGSRNRIEQLQDVGYQVPPLTYVRPHVQSPNHRWSGWCGSTAKTKLDNWPADCFEKNHMPLLQLRQCQDSSKTLCRIFSAGDGSCSTKTFLKECRFSGEPFLTISPSNVGLALTFTLLTKTAMRVSWESPQRGTQWASLPSCHAKQSDTQLKDFKAAYDGFSYETYACFECLCGHTLAERILPATRTSQNDRVTTMVPVVPAHRDDRRIKAEQCWLINGKLTTSQATNKIHGSVILLQYDFRLPLSSLFGGHQACQDTFYKSTRGWVVVGQVIFVLHNLIIIYSHETHNKSIANGTGPHRLLKM